MYAWAWLIFFSVVYCCSELGESNLSHHCLGELGLPDIFCQFTVVIEHRCGFVLVLISFWLPFPLDMYADRVNIAGLLSLKRCAYKIGSGWHLRSWIFGAFPPFHNR